jgi:hypothetical protein
VNAARRCHVERGGRRAATPTNRGRRHKADRSTRTGSTYSTQTGTPSANRHRARPAHVEDPKGRSRSSSRGRTDQMTRHCGTGPPSTPHRHFARPQSWASLCHLQARRATVDGEATEPEDVALSRVSASIIERCSRRRRGGRLRRRSWRRGCTAIGRMRRSPRPGRVGRSVSRRQLGPGRVRPW